MQKICLEFDISNFSNLRSSQYLPSYPISHTQVVSPLTESGLQVPLLRQGLMPQGSIKHYKT